MMIKWFTNEQKWFCLRAMVSKSSLLTFTCRNAPESYWVLPGRFSTANLVNSILVEGTTFVFHFCRNINAYWVSHFSLSQLFLPGSTLIRYTTCDFYFCRNINAYWVTHFSFCTAFVPSSILINCATFDFRLYRCWAISFPFARLSYTFRPSFHVLFPPLFLWVRPPGRRPHLQSAVGLSKPQVFLHINCFKRKYYAVSECRRWHLSRKPSSVLTLNCQEIFRKWTGWFMVAASTVLNSKLLFPLVGLLSIDR